MGKYEPTDINLLPGSGWPLFVTSPFDSVNLLPPPHVAVRDQVQPKPRGVMWIGFPGSGEQGWLEKDKSKNSWAGNPWNAADAQRLQQSRLEILFH